MNKIKDLFIKNPKIKVVAILVGVALGIFLITFILWTFVFSKYYIFQEQENKFLDAVKRYYEFRENLLPKKGEIREVTLEKLFSENRIESLTVPKSDKLCDTNSWVRVYHNEEGEYIYYTYLKCGKYESNIDHEGPKITLNGASEVIVNLGENYEELGVKSVTDDTDGDMKVRQVEIDSSKVDTSKVGTYKVTYKVMDSLNNQTKVTRTVIVARNLTETVKEATDESNYYKGVVDNNYLLFSGMMWRIIGANEDGTIELISATSITNLRYDEAEYENSNIKLWLEEKFYPKINNADKYLVATEYCTGNITMISDLSTVCSKTIKAKIGLLSIDKLMRSRIDNKNSFLSMNAYTALSNKINENLLITTNLVSEGYFETGNDKLPGIRPVITLTNDIHIISGDGTKDNPYKLEDYEYGKEHDKLNDRLVGEYVEFSGHLTRINDIDDNGNVKLIFAQPLMNLSENTPLTVSFLGVENVSFDLKNESSPVYILNNNYIDYINDVYVINEKYNIPTNVINKKLSSYELKTINAKLSIPMTYDLFSSVDDTALSRKYLSLFIDESETDNLLFILNPGNGMTFELDSKSFQSYTIKPIFTISGDLKIKSGNGTINKPYYLK